MRHRDALVAPCKPSQPAGWRSSWEQVRRWLRTTFYMLTSTRCWLGIAFERFIHLYTNKTSAKKVGLCFSYIANFSLSCAVVFHAWCGLCCCCCCCCLACFLYSYHIICTEGGATSDSTYPGTPSRLLERARSATVSSSFQSACVGRLVLLFLSL